MSDKVKVKTISPQIIQVALMSDREHYGATIDNLTGEQVKQIRELFGVEL